jgi:hypothetical protein
MTTQLSPCPKQQFFDDSGVPLAGGYIYTYEAGTDTMLATYTDSTGTVQNANPIVLDGAGRAEIWLSNAAYKFKLLKADATVVWTVDNIGILTALYSIANTITDLRALVSGSALTVNVLGYSAISDGGGGIFYWSASSMATDDNGIVIRGTDTSSGNPGRWVRILTGYVTPKMYGATGLGISTDDSAVQAADVYAYANSLYLFVDNGTYLITTPTLTSKVVFGPTGIIKWTSGITPTMAVSISDQNRHFIANSGYGVTFSGITDIYPEWFGAIGGGSFADNTTGYGTPDTAYIQSAITSGQAGQWVVLNSSKKYWSGLLYLKAGVNLRGSQPRCASSSSYAANLQFSGASGNFLYLPGPVRGVVIKDLIVDGNALASNIINLGTYSSLIEYCTIRNTLTGSAYCGILLTSADPSTTLNNVINNCEIYSTDYGISSLLINSCTVSECTISACIRGINTTGTNWIIRDNNLSTCTTYGIIIDGGTDYKIQNNIIDDVQGNGIYISNTTASLPVVSGNKITCLTHSSAVGIQVATAVTATASYIDISNNTLECAGALTSVTGIKTVNSGGVLAGSIVDNDLIGFTIKYNIADSYLTLLRYNAPALSQYQANLGAFGSLGALDSAAQLTILNDTALGTTSTSKVLLESLGGYSSSTTIYNRKWLTRNTDSTFSGTRFHDDMGLVATNASPRVDDYTWYERVPATGRHAWGNGSTEYAYLNASTFVSNVAFSAPNFASGWIPTSSSFTMGNSAVDIVVTSDVGSLSAFSVVFCKCYIMGNTAFLNISLGITLSATAGYLLFSVQDTATTEAAKFYGPKTNTMLIGHGLYKNLSSGVLTSAYVISTATKQLKFYPTVANDIAVGSQTIYLNCFYEMASSY